MKKVRSRKVKDNNTASAIISRVRKMKPPEPVRPCKGRIIDYIIDMYEMPDQVELRRVYSGALGARQDALNMRSYFNAARGKIMSDGKR